MNVTEQFVGFSLLGAQWVIWLLLVLSVVTVTIIIERAIFYFGQRPDVDTLIRGVRERMIRSDLDGAREYLEGVKGVAPAVGRFALAEAERGAGAVDEAAASAMVRQRLMLERNLVFLGTAGNTAPFVGLFGTIIGIMQAFHELSANIQGGAGAVMSGITEALVSTAVGLMVAVPSVVAFNLFKRRASMLLGDADALVHGVLSGLQGERPDPEKG